MTALLMAEPAPPLLSHGEGLLPASMFEGKDQVAGYLQAAYHSVMGKGLRDWGLWQQSRRGVVEELKRRYLAAGLEAAPIDWDAFWARIDLPRPQGDGNAHVRLVEALLTPYNRTLMEQIEYRHANGGNTHLEFTGPTGYGKSSCAIGLAHAIDPIPRGKLLEHLCLDAADLPARLVGKKPRQTVIKDDNFETSGEGSLTVKKTITNTENTLRAAGVNLFLCSPIDQELGTMQAKLEVFMWCPKRHFSVHLVWRGDVPLGVVALPWDSEQRFREEYSPWKAVNVDRTMRAMFKDTTYLARQAIDAFRNQFVVDYLVAATNKPIKKDFTTAVKLFAPSNITTSQEDRVVDFMVTLTHNYERLKPKIKTWLDMKDDEPLPDGFLAVAEKCFKES